MKRIVILVPLVAIALVSLVFLVYGKTSVEDVPILEEKISFEDAIIINELEMSSEKPPANEVAEKAEENIVSFSLSSLKRKDRRWHLTRYIIRKNDSIWKIAQKFDVNHQFIIRANKIKNARAIAPGRTILVPNTKGLWHRVSRGESVISIGKKYHIPYKKIIRHNGIHRGKIYLGQKLFIPDAVKVYAKKEKHSGKSFVRRSGRDKKYHKRDMRVVHRKKGQTIHKQTARPHFIWPLRGPITSGFGTRNDPITGKKAFHCGIDIGANTGTLIKASASGRVIYSGWKSSYGNVVILRHKSGYITVYAHLSKFKVKRNDNVKKNQVIALTGNTGATTGPHLHFEIRKYVTPLNPLRFLK